MRGIPVAGAESRHYAAATRGGDPVDVYVYDQDQQAAGAFTRLSPHRAAPPRGYG